MLFLSLFLADVQTKKNTACSHYLATYEMLTLHMIVESERLFRQTRPTALLCFQSAVKPRGLMASAYVDWQARALLGKIMNLTPHPQSGQGSYQVYHLFISCCLPWAWWHSILNQSTMSTGCAPFGSPECISDSPANPHRKVRVDLRLMCRACAPNESCQEPG